MNTLLDTANWSEVNLSNKLLAVMYSHEKGKLVF